MYHSITIGSRNTWDDWHLIPSSRPLVNPPPVEEKMVDIPGVDSSLDMTNVLTGRPRYGSRSGSWGFVVAPDYWDWTTAYETIMAYLHGKRFRCVLEDDPEWFYEGRFKVNQWKSDRNFSQIVIDYIVDAYKRSIISTTDPWLWDPFSFENGVIRFYEDIPVSSLMPETILVGGSERVVPTFIASDDMNVWYASKEIFDPMSDSCEDWKRINSSGAIVRTDDNSFGVSGYIPVEASKQYRIESCSPETVTVYSNWYTSGKSRISTVSGNGFKTSPSNAAYLRFTYYLDKKYDSSIKAYEVLSLSAGENKKDDIVIGPGKNIFLFTIPGTLEDPTPSGTVSVRYRVGEF